MRVLPLSALPLVLMLSACAVPFIAPGAASPRGPEREVTLDGRTMTVRRSAETFPVSLPINAIGENGITVTPEAPVPVRGQGEPAVVVTGTALGERALAARAVYAVCGLTEDQGITAGFEIHRGTYDADRAEALFPVTSCPALDGPAAP